MYRIISTDNHLEWKKIISLCKEECIFLDLKYIKTFEEEKLVKGKLFFYKNKKKYFALPFLISSLKKYGYRNFEKFFDIETPYGYGGFISNTKDVKFLNKAIMSFNLYAKNNKIDQVIHLGAQAGVRYSISNPQFYIDTNITGFLNILENSKNFKVQNIIYASSSSIYGINEKMPFSENDKTEKQISMYGVSKKTNELMAHTYSNLYGLNTVGLRFFTVYGPWGRPDMALYIFTKAIIENKRINLFNEGDHTRSFTYIDDITEPIHRLIKINYNNDRASYNEILNIGGSSPVKLLRFIDIIEEYLGKKAKINLKPMQQGDVKETNADIDKLERITGYRPQINIEEGIKRFIDWYVQYHQ